MRTAPGRKNVKEDTMKFLIEININKEKLNAAGESINDFNFEDLKKSIESFNNRVTVINIIPHYGNK